MRAVKLMIAAILGMGFAFAGATTLTAVTKGEPTMSADRDGQLSRSEQDTATKLVANSDIGAVLLKEYGGTIGGWEPATVEGEARGAVATVTLSKPSLFEPKVLRPIELSSEQLNERSADSDIAQLDPADYQLATTTHAAEVVTAYTVVIDIPTQTIVLMVPKPEAPVTVGEPRRASTEEVLTPTVRDEAPSKSAPTESNDRNEEPANDE